jgi:hypothetical protein
MSIQELAYQIETKKMLRDLDLNYDGHSWYEAELLSLGQVLKKLLKD